MFGIEDSAKKLATVVAVGFIVSVVVNIATTYIISNLLSETKRTIAMQVAFSKAQTEMMSNTFTRFDIVTDNQIKDFYPGYKSRFDTLIIGDDTLVAR